MTGLQHERSSRATRSSRAAAPWSSASARGLRPRGRGERGHTDARGLPARPEPGRLLADDRRRQHGDPQDEPDRDRERDHDRLPDGRRRGARHGPQPDEVRPRRHLHRGRLGWGGGSNAIAGTAPPIRAAAVSARQALLGLAAAQFGCRPRASPSARESSPAAGSRAPTGSCSAGSSSTSACRRATTWRRWAALAHRPASSPARRRRRRSLPTSSSGRRRRGSTSRAR